MKNTRQKRTNRTLLLHIMQKVAEEGMEQAFLRRFPQKRAYVDKEITEQEYQFGLQKIREEFPAFKRYLLAYPDCHLN